LTGHRDIKTTLTVYPHLLNTDDHADVMAALDALVGPNTNAINVLSHFRRTPKFSSTRQSGQQRT
jgi:hypothetical protein